MINVIIVEDKKIIRESITALINASERFSCIKGFEDCESFLASPEIKDADIVLMDIGLPGISGIEGVQKLKQLYPELDVMMLTIYEDNQKIFDALCAGACGYLLKNTPPEELIKALDDLYNGGSPMSPQIARKVVSLFRGYVNEREEDKHLLTSREKEVLASLASGNSYQEIGDSLFISIDTVRQHIRSIYYKLQVHSQSQAVAQAIKRGII
jgi:DNA-binding NarL/FixJ family response regulator